MDSVYNLLFGCRHTRTTFPLTPVKQGASGSGETYVVCLECGKQFTYDWEQMRLGKPADISAGPAAPHPEAARIPFKTKSKLRYLLLASALPAAWVIRSAIQSRKRSRAIGISRQEDERRNQTEDPKTPGPA